MPPLTGAAAGAPDYRDQTPLVYYVPGEWKRRVISTENSGVVHGIFVTDWDGNGRDDILTASFTGIHLFRYGKDATWTRTEIAKGDPAPWPKSGSSDIAVGHLANRASWPPSNPGTAIRSPSTPSSAAVGSRGHRHHPHRRPHHTGCRSQRRRQRRNHRRLSRRSRAASTSTNYDTAAKHWTRSDLDKGGMGAAACAVADLNDDGRPDVACIDSHAPEVVRKRARP